MPMNERELDLFDAFVAGFNAAGEGFNGEYIGERYRGKDNQLFRERMLAEFQAWRNSDA